MWCLRSVVAGYDSLNCTYSTDVYYLILHHAQAIFCVCVCVSQLLLVNPDQLVCQKRVTDTVDLKAISRPAVCNSLLFSHLFFCVFPPLLSSPLLHCTHFFLSFSFPHLYYSHDSCTTIWYCPHCFSLCTQPWFYDSLCPLPCLFVAQAESRTYIKMYCNWHPTFKQDNFQLFKLLNTSDVCSWPVNKLLYS